MRRILTRFCLQVLLLSKCHKDCSTSSKIKIAPRQSSGFNFQIESTHNPKDGVIAKG